MALGKKTGGRAKGAQNRATIEFKQALTNLFDYAAPQMVDWLEQIDSPEKRFDVLSKLGEFCYPKLARSEHTGLDGAPIEHKITQTDSEILERWKNKT